MQASIGTLQKDAKAVKKMAYAAKERGDLEAALGLFNVAIELNDTIARMAREKVAECDGRLAAIEVDVADAIGAPIRFH